MEADTKVATSLGLLNVFGTLSSLMQARMTKDPDLDGQGLSMTLDYPWVRITCHEDVKSGLTIELPFNGHHVVWIDVSDDSFQVTVVALEVMHRVFTRSQFTKTLATVEFDFTQPVVNFRPQCGDWKCVEPGTYNHLRLEFHDTHG